MCLHVVEPSGFRVLGFFRCLRRYLSINETTSPSTPRSLSLESVEDRKHARKHAHSAVGSYTNVCQMYEHNLDPYLNSNLHCRPWRPFSGSAEHYTSGARLRTACFDGCPREAVTLNNAHSRWNWLGCTAQCWSRTGRTGASTRHSAGPIKRHHTSMPRVQECLCMCLPALWPLQEDP